MYTMMRVPFKNILFNSSIFPYLANDCVSFLPLLNFLILYPFSHLSRQNSSPNIPKHEREDSQLLTVKSIICKALMPCMNAGLMQMTVTTWELILPSVPNEGEPMGGPKGQMDGLKHGLKPTNTNKNRNLAFLKGEWATGKCRMFCN